MKCLVKETFATVDIVGVKGTIIDLPMDEAKAKEYHGLVTILNPDEHLPIAFETAEAAMTGKEEAVPKMKRGRKPKPPSDNGLQII